MVWYLGQDTTVGLPTNSVESWLPVEVCKHKFWWMLSENYVHQIFALWGFEDTELTEEQDSLMAKPASAILGERLKEVTLIHFVQSIQIWMEDAWVSLWAQEEYWNHSLVVMGLRKCSNTSKNMMPACWTKNGKLAWLFCFCALIEEACWSKWGINMKQCSWPYVKIYVKILTVKDLKCSASAVSYIACLCGSIFQKIHQ